VRHGSTRRRALFQRSKAIFPLRLACIRPFILRAHDDEAMMRPMMRPIDEPHDGLTETEQADPPSFYGTVRKAHPRSRSPGVSQRIGTSRRPWTGSGRWAWVVPHHSEKPAASIKKRQLTAKGWRALRTHEKLDPFARQPKLARLPTSWCMSSGPNQMARIVTCAGNGSS